MMDSWIFWMILSVIALIIELFTVGFAVICFTAGALVAALSAYIGLSPVWQGILFALFSVLAFLLVRPLLIKHMPRERKSTNVNALEGRVAVVSENFTNGAGRVKIDGDDWRAECEGEGQGLNIGDKVKVVRVESVTLIVKK